MRRRLYLCVPSATAYAPAFGFVELHDQKVTEARIQSEHLPEWIKAVDALRIHLGVMQITQKEGGDIVASDLPSVREWIKSMLELRIERVIDDADKRAEGAVVPTLATAIIDPRRINQFRREGDQ